MIRLLGSSSELAELKTVNRIPSKRTSPSKLAAQMYPVWSWRSALMELTGRPSFTVHDSCTHDGGPASLVGGVARASCACASETVLSASTVEIAVATLRRAAERRGRRAKLPTIMEYSSSRMTCRSGDRMEPWRGSYALASVSH